MDPEGFTDILQSSERERCAEFSLVLASQAIESRVAWNGSRWVLWVAEHDVAAARRELEAYATEAWMRERSRRTPITERANGNPWPGVVIYLTVVLGMALMAPDLGFGIDWLAAGRIDGGRVLAGEWWRPITALTLHADAAHLLGNAFFGAFFGYSVARYLGGGFAWLAIVVCGAIGNLANAYLSGPDHRSIGASTAVFAALGILSAYCWRHGFPPEASRRERLAPVIAGIGLLAFTGTGGVNTDIGAHLLGFVAGFCGGLIIARLGFPRAANLQLVAGLLAIALVIAAWLGAVF
jgi:rhomboid protease GluP